VAGRLMSPANFGELWFGSASLSCDANEPTAVLSLCTE
jgi:hypothetical protein